MKRTWLVGLIIGAALAICTGTALAEEVSARAEEESEQTAPPAELEEEAVKEAENASEPVASQSPKKKKMLTVGVGAPLAGFASYGIIKGSGWANTSSDFLWGNLDLRFLFRLKEKFSIGGGFLQTFILFDGVGVMGGHLVADFRWYAVPDYLYFKMDLIFGFPMFFAIGPAMGHSFSVNKKVHIFIENQFLFMAVAGVYGFWQPTVGVCTRF